MFKLNNYTWVLIYNFYPVEFHYQEDVDVWVEIQDGIEKITYTDEVSKKLKELEEDSESDANSNN